MICSEQGSDLQEGKIFSCECPCLCEHAINTTLTLLVSNSSKTREGYDRVRGILP